MKKCLFALACLLALQPGALAQQKRPLQIDDIFQFRTVGDARISPDGAWIAYTVSRLDRERDARDADIYMVPFGGGDAIRLTTSDKAERSPRWSPDGRYLAFVANRDDTKAQVWLLDRRGGEATKLTDYRGGVSSFEWSPDSTRLAVVATDPDPDEAKAAGQEKDKAPKPIVIRRLLFKRDGVGFLDEFRDHIHVFDVAKKTSVQITDGPYDDGSPAWSPDGRSIAFVSNRTKEPDANHNTDIFVVAAAGGEPRPVASSPAAESAPVFTPDGRSLVYLLGGEPTDIWYATNNIAVVPVAGGAPRTLTPDVDRNLSGPKVSEDGAWVLFLIEDRNHSHLARVPIGGGRLERVVDGEREVTHFDAGPQGRIAVIESVVDRPGEISTLGPRGALTRVTRANDEFLAGIALGTTERFTARGADGIEIDGFLVRPPNAPVGTKLPTLLRIHGGPVSQYAAAFQLEWQMFAAHGYAVVGANPRGSSGRGRDFSYAIWADWGNRDYDDVMAAVDHVVKNGVADPDRLGVGGWSYGGILTNYVITKTDRFKAAISGSSEVNYLANYGHDHYLREWEAELGLPWERTDLWISMSPFFKVANIKTPTLVLCGQEDWNVPLINSEQLYQALRRLGVPTELVIYPGQSHSIDRPSFQKDRYERYLAWYDRYLRGRS
jgi:dipeptidyl aminopeptidase/acylaminoacyl peptidase